MGTHARPLPSIWTICRGRESVGGKGSHIKAVTSRKGKTLKALSTGAVWTADGPEQQLCCSETEHRNLEGTGQQAKVGL